MSTTQKDVKGNESTLVIEYEDIAEPENSRLVEIIPIQSVSSSKKRKQNHQNIKELNNDEIHQFELNKSIRMESPQFEYENFEDDISRDSSKDSYAKPHIDDDDDMIVLKKKNSLPKMMQKVLKPTNSLIKPRIKKELAEARKLGKLMSPKKDEIMDEEEKIEPGIKIDVKQDPVAELLPEEEIMVSAAKFEGPPFLFVRCSFSLDNTLKRLDDQFYTVSGISVEQVMPPPPVIDSIKPIKSEKKEKKLLEKTSPPARESPRSKKQAPEVKSKVGRKRKVPV